MAVYTTRENQSLLDVVVQLTGSTDYLAGLAALNNLPVTNVLPAGTQVTYDESRLQGDPTARHFDLNDLFVVTATTDLLPTDNLPTPNFTRVTFPAYVPAPTDYSARANQSMLDVAVQLYGNLDHLVELCAANSVIVSQVAPVGSPLVFDLIKQQESTPAAYIALNDRQVNTWSRIIGAVEVEDEYEPTEYEDSEYA